MTQGIRILCPSWIRIRIRNADPDPGGRSLKITKEKIKELLIIVIHSNQIVKNGSRKLIVGADGESIKANFTR